MVIDMILQLENLEAAYGMSQVLFGVNLNVREQQVTCLLGRNGVGKSTTCANLGVELPQAGKKVLLADCDPSPALPSA